jgi:hypothetical protein
MVNLLPDAAREQDPEGQVVDLDLLEELVEDGGFLGVRDDWRTATNWAAGDAVIAFVASGSVEGPCNKWASQAFRLLRPGKGVEGEWTWRAHAETEDGVFELGFTF